MLGSAIIGGPVFAAGNLGSDQRIGETTITDIRRRPSPGGPVLSNKAMPRNKSSVRSIFPASRSSSSFTCILRYRSCSECGRHYPLPSLAEHQQADHSGNEENCVSQGQSHFDWSKSSDLLRIMKTDPHPGNRPLPSRDLPPGCGNANFTRDDGPHSEREKVITTLTLYRDICRLLEREKLQAGKESRCIRRVDFHAAKEVKKRVGYVHGHRQFIGEVPGVEVGDKFYYRMELAVVGLHRPPQNGIDYMGPHPDILATSVVASWDYADDLTDPNELVYLGEGGMPSHVNEAEDQKLTRGNLALANSMKRSKPVRVIRKDWDDTFKYDGLYVVDRYRKSSRANRKMVFEFVMKKVEVVELSD
ncbi:histone-lysine N-methyltransferase, H3 lysine-9 specific SUVH6-like [Syzygium oleosum]|uniref:histone-lysine N-methyltransferase, H3 lysine-9 specific SUVH6-like n=1 Tax=Syzygium oleosum TaxID=219896 RepID=UPI0011D2144D|nr:histone-lysine N-methyltransferase, H3 lysine-9 specific SUVH6-like [Syzygium oleosum]